MARGHLSIYARVDARNSSIILSQMYVSKCHSTTPLVRMDSFPFVLTLEQLTDIPLLEDLWCG